MPIRGPLGARGSLAGPLGVAGTAAAGWWLAAGVTPIAAYQAKGAASQAASYVNLVTPGTYNAAPGVAPTWAAATGWTFASQWLTTGYVAPSDGSHTVIIRYSGATAAGATGIFGARDSLNSNYFAILPNFSAQVYYYSGGSPLTKAPALTGGVLAIAGNVAFRNGAAESGTITTTARTYGPLAIGGISTYAGSAVLLIAASVQAFAVFNSVLSPAQVGLITTAMAAL